MVWFFDKGLWRELGSRCLNKMPTRTSQMLFVQVRKLEWRCRGCFSISDTKESRVAVLENELPLSLIFPDRYNQIPSKYHPSVKKHHPNTKKNHPNTKKYHPNTSTHTRENNPKILRFSIVRDEAGFSLSISPSRSDDSGIYFCPTRGLRLAIQVSI